MAPGYAFVALWEVLKTEEYAGCLVTLARA